MTCHHPSLLLHPGVIIQLFRWKPILPSAHQWFNGTTGIADNDSVKCPSCKPDALSIFIHNGTMMAIFTGTKAYAILHHHFPLNITLPTSDTP